MSNSEITGGIIDHLRKVADPSGVLPYVTFIREALYNPDFGYYRSARNRVGRDRHSDFFTSISFRKLFRQLLVCAIKQVLGSDYFHRSIFIEIGAEPGTSLMDMASHPFQEVRVLRLGDRLSIPSNSIVFCNELFDAQPFHRLVFSDQKWRERGVRIHKGSLTEVLLDTLTPEAQSAMERIPWPERKINGYQLDLPLAAQTLLESIISQEWKGAFFCFDYGKSWEALANDIPNGTARGYRKHRQVSDLLANPGEMDITCHICWDFLIQALENVGFQKISLERQEAFFVNRALSEWFSMHGGPEHTGARQRIQELIHPDRMGHAFQVLHAVRV